MMVNQLHINLTKSYFMNFGNKSHSKKSSKNLKLFLNNTEVKEVDEIKFLGIIIDNKLSWGPHITHLSKKLSSCIGALNRMKHAIPEKLNYSLYHTVFESHLSYGISVWGGVGNTLLEKLFALQKRCIRLLFGDYEKFIEKFKTCARIRPYGKQFLDYKFYEKEHSKPLFNSEKIMTVHNLYIYHCCLEMIKILKLRTPISLYSCLKFNISDRKPTLMIRPDKSNSFLYRATKIWNCLKCHVLTNTNDFSDKFNKIKNNLKAFLIMNQSKLSNKNCAT